MKKLLKFIIFYFICIIVGTSIIYLIFKPILKTNSLIFPYAINKFDICKVYPETWKLIKKFYFITFEISYSIFLSKLFKNLKFKENSQKLKKCIVSTDDKLKLIVGTDENNRIVEIEENGLYQNIFITGTIGSGKTSSAMYPFTKQLMEYKAFSTKEKLAMLILDVKGNYSEKVKEFAIKCGRENDIHTVDI